MIISHERTRPMSCDSRAYEYVRSNLPQIESTAGLLHCALGVAMHAIEDLDIGRVLAQITGIAGEIRRRTATSNAKSLVAHLHAVLFDEMGFHVARGEYFYHPLSSYLPAVIATKQGIPVSLALIYKAVASELGLGVRGVAAKGRFFVQVFDGSTWILVDVCENGRILTSVEASIVVQRLSGDLPLAAGSHLQAATHRQWLERIIVNLAYVFHSIEQTEDYSAMQDLLQLVRSNAITSQSVWN